ncbi:hypothetical protein D0Y65_006695 [Glycine soja]|uniref:DNA helicase Pif1-like 2B domain-containing protein n=1 Tax=Glycine soja TaxID=3848 RepID=A0A445L9U7_GLYSO|nr:hypothetical protein D0Y65_006695 [Glycine soja]
MLIRNLDQADGLCNGTKLIITRLGSNVVESEHSSDCLATIRFTTPLRIQKNLLQVPLSFHSQWMYRYPNFFQQQLPDLSMVTKNLLPFSVHGLAKRTQWDVTIHNGVPSIADPWFHFLHEKKLMPEDEVVFYYRLDDHAWELLIRKDIEWDNEDINFDN